MLRSLYSGISGVKNQQAQMDVISNNIANANTDGFKTGRMTFSDALSETISGARGTAGNFGGANPIQIGRGSVISSIDTNFKQGSLDSTGMLTDVAINGKGFFIVSDGDKTYYSRAGAFQVQEDGTLMSQGGAQYVMGGLADADGNLTSSTAISKIVLPFGRKEPAKATENIDFYCNLDKNASKTEEWMGSKAFAIDGDPASLTSDLAVLDSNTIHLGDVIEITGADKDGNKILDGNETWTFEYGKDGTTIQDLITKINEAFNSTDAINGSTASLDQNGRLRLLANTAGVNKSSIFLTASSANHEATVETHTATTNYKAIPTTIINDLASTTTDYVAGDTLSVTVGGGAAQIFTFTTGNETMQDVVNWINSGVFGATNVTATLTANAGGTTAQILNSGTGGAIAIADTAGTGAGFAGTGVNYVLPTPTQYAAPATNLNTLSGVRIVDGQTITISGTNPDGTNVNASFKYGATNDGVTIQSLLNKINDKFSGVTATINDQGFIILTDNASGESGTSISITDGTSTGFTRAFSTESFSSASAFEVAGAAATGATALNTLDGITAYAEGDVIKAMATKADGTTAIVTFTYGLVANGYDGTTMDALLNKINGGRLDGITAALDAEGKIVFTDSSLTDVNSYTSIELFDGKRADGTANTGSGIGREFASDAGSVAGTDNSINNLPSFSEMEKGVTGTHSTSIWVYDSLGDKHQVEMKYTQDTTAGSNKWYWNVVVDDGVIVPNAGNSGSVSFNEDGSLKSFNYDNGDKLKFRVPGSSEVTISLNAGTAGAFDGITQLASPSTNVAINQDGYTLGILNNISIDDQGIVTGVYSNGISKALAQVALANFTNEGGLQREGNSLYSANASSGDPIVGWAGSNTKSVIKAGYLESSNVDLTDEFAKMIISQRALEANAKVIGTADTILQTIINQMKRS